MGKQVTVWDGVSFAKIDEVEARELEAQDKVQVIERAMSGTEYKTRSQFTGYSNKMMTTGRNRQMVPESPPKEAVNQPAPKAEPNPPEKPDDAPAPVEETKDNWRSKRGPVAKYLGKKATEVTKAEVERYSGVIKHGST